MAETLNELVAMLKDKGVLNSPELELAFKRVDRRDFLPEHEQYHAYENHPLPIGFHQTNSQPFTVAFMLGLLDLKEDSKVLDIGSGSGWTTALIAFIVSKRGSVEGLERIKALADFGRDNLKKYAFTNAEIHYVDKGIGLQDEQFDRILVSAAAKNLPKGLIKQLRPGGILVVPVRNAIVVVKKALDDEMVMHEYPGFAFVPLVM